MTTDLNVLGTITLLYLGTEELGKEKEEVGSFYPLEAGWQSQPYLDVDANSKGIRYFSKKGIKKYFKGSPGTVWTVQGNAGTIDPSSFRCIGVWQHRNEVMKWQAADEAKRMVFWARKDSIKVANDETLETALEPLRQLYHSSVGLSRQMLIARIVAYITS